MTKTTELTGVISVDNLPPQQEILEELRILNERVRNAATPEEEQQQLIVLQSFLLS